MPQVSEYAVDEVAAALRLSRPAAGGRLQLAVELAGRLPATAAALAAGVIDVPKARAVVEAVAAFDDGLAAAVEARVLPAAGRRTVGQLRAVLATAVLSVDPAAAEDRHTRAAAGREVTIRPLADGMAGLWALLPADAAAAVYTHLDRIARAAPAADPRGMDARRADALVAAVLAGTTAPPATPCQPPPVTGGRCREPSPAASRPVPRLRADVHVTVPAATALGSGDQPGELTGHGPIPASMARRLTAAGKWRRVSLDPDTGTVTDVGRLVHPPPRSPTWFAPATAAAASPAAATPPAAPTSTTSPPGRRPHHRRQPGRPLPPPPPAQTPNTVEVETTDSARCTGPAPPPPLHHHPSRALPIGHALATVDFAVAEHSRVLATPPDAWGGARLTGRARRQHDPPVDVTIETERMVLRAFNADDVDNLVELDGDPEVMRYLTGGQPTSREAVRTGTLPWLMARPEPGGASGGWPRWNGRPAPSSAGSACGRAMARRTSCSSAIGCAAPPGAGATPPRGPGR